MKKIAHAADLHYRDSDFEEIKKCVDHFVKTVRIELPDLILVSGDIFDWQGVRLDSLSARCVAKQFIALANVAPVAVVIGTPSHDGTAAKILPFLNTKHKIHVSETPEQLYLYNKDLHVHSPENGETSIDIIVSQMPTPTKKTIDISGGISDSNKRLLEYVSESLRKFGALACAIPGNPAHVLNGHFDVNGSRVSKTQVLSTHEIKLSKEQLDLTSAHLFALGHIHMRQQIHGNIFYSGSIYRKDFGETEEKGFYIHELDGSNHLTSRFINVPARALRQRFFDFTSPEPQPDFDMTGKILDSFSCPVEDSWVKILINVFQDQANRINRGQIIDQLKTKFGASRVVFKVSNKPRVNVRAEKILKMKTLSEKVVELAAMRDEDLAPGVLDKAIALETMSDEEVLNWALSNTQLPTN